jgi:SAM-dependent methyltransferase
VVGKVSLVPDRNRQLAYTDIQPLMHDEASRRKMDEKIISVLTHFLGSPLEGRTVLDVGCSTGFIADQLRRAGGHVIGADIDLPGLTAARARFRDGVGWLIADGEELPLATGSVDVVVFNQIYEHVVDPDAVMAEIRRVLRPDGVVYLGLGNRLTIMEPHVRLPFASWLPAAAADRYVRLAGRGSAYHERFRTKPGLRRLVHGLQIWDYTWTVVAEPTRFAADDQITGLAGRLPLPALRLLAPVIPTYIWVGTLGSRQPRGGSTIVPPSFVPVGG